jgi:hypothetical protein
MIESELCDFPRRFDLWDNEEMEIMREIIESISKFRPGENKLPEKPLSIENDSGRRKSRNIFQNPKRISQTNRTPEFNMLCNFRTFSSPCVET